MTNKSLFLGVVALCVLPAAAFAQVLIDENFDSLGVETRLTSGSVGPFFEGTNVEITGPRGRCRAPAASGLCLFMQNMTGQLVSHPVMLVGGHTYVLSFDLQGNSVAGANTTSTTTVTLGSLFDRTFTLTNGGLENHFDIVKQAITVPGTGTEIVDLSFKGAGGAAGNRTNGMVIDNILLASAPEPATLGLMVLGLLGGGFVGRKRRN